MTLSESEYDCINPIILLESITKSVKASDFGEEEKKKLLGYLQDVV